MLVFLRKGVFFVENASIFACSLNKQKGRNSERELRLEQKGMCRNKKLFRGFCFGKSCNSAVIFPLASLCEQVDTFKSFKNAAVLRRCGTSAFQAVVLRHKFIPCCELLSVPYNSIFLKNQHFFAKNAHAGLFAPYFCRFLCN